MPVLILSYLSWLQEVRLKITLSFLCMRHFFPPQCYAIMRGVVDFHSLSDSARIVIHPNQTIAVDAGNTITFVCVARGDPDPSISWSRGDTVISNVSQVTIYEELVTENGVTFVQSILELCNPEEADAGQYSCFADNTIGNDTASFVLTVNAQSKQ